MSIFQLKDFWHYTPDTPALITSHSSSASHHVTATQSSQAIWVGTIDPSSSGCRDSGSLGLDSEWIIVGDLSGTLRVFQVDQDEFSPHQLLFERELSQPILQVDVITVNDTRCAAVLHPSSISIYSFPKNGEIYNLQLEQTIKLPSPCANFTFGTTTPEDPETILYAQSLDGTLTFIDTRNGQIIGSRKLKWFVAPGPLAWVSKRGGEVLTGSSGYALECYSVRNTIENGRDGSVIDPIWTRTLGENILDIHLGRIFTSTPSSETDIIVLGLRTLFILQETSEIKVQILLSTPPLTLTPFPNPQSQNLTNLILCDTSGTYRVYDQMQVVWGCTSPHTPLAIRVGKFSGINGFIVSLSPTGTLTVSYLGTDPASYNLRPPVLELGQDAEIDKMQKELGNLEKEIRKRPIQEKTRVPIAATVDFPTKGDSSMFQLTLRNQGFEEVQEVQVSVWWPPGVRTEEHTWSVGYLQPASKLDLSTDIYTSSAVPLLTLAFQLVVSYKMLNGTHNTATFQNQLPLSYAGAYNTATNEEGVKFTLETNTEPIPLHHLYPNLPQNLEPYVQKNNAIGFHFHTGGEKAVLIGSKNSGRYRIAGTSLGGVWIMFEDLCRRLRKAGKLRGKEVSIKMAEPLPLSMFYGNLEAYVQ
ncbi:hypothetical protein HDV05_007661, partial [Chytridiales sp. JEL 0842]